MTNTTIITVETKVQWAKEQMKVLENWARGFGFHAIDSKIKLQHIKTLSKEEFEEAAILNYDRVHGLN